MKLIQFMLLQGKDCCTIYICTIVLHIQAIQLTAISESPGFWFQATTMTLHTSLFRYIKTQSKKKKDIDTHSLTKYIAIVEYIQYQKLFQWYFK